MTKAWINISKMDYYFKSREEADSFASPSRIACIEFDLPEVITKPILETKKDPEPVRDTIFAILGTNQ